MKAGTLLELGAETDEGVARTGQEQGNA